MQEWQPERLHTISTIKELNMCNNTLSSSSDPFDGRRKTPAHAVVGVAERLAVGQRVSEFVELGDRRLDLPRHLR